MKEDVVVGGAIAGNFPQNEFDVARGRNRRAIRGILRGIRGIVALDGNASGRADRGSWRKMKDHAGLDFERRAQLDRGACRAGNGLRGRIRQTQLRQQRGNAHGFLRPVHEFQLSQHVFHGEGLSRGVGIRSVDGSDLPAEAVREREKLR